MNCAEPGPCCSGKLIKTSALVHSKTLEKKVQIINIKREYSKREFNDLMDKTDVILQNTQT